MNNAFPKFKQLFTPSRYSELLEQLQTSPQWGRFVKRLPRYTNFFLITLTLYTSALLTWEFFPKPPLIPPSAALLTKLPMPGNNSQSLYTGVDIARWSLFGTESKAAPVSKLPLIDVTKIKEAPINLTLIGVIYSPHVEEQVAIITGVPNAKKDEYKIGQNVNTNFRIEQILPDQVILIHNNERVSLKLRKAKEKIPGLNAPMKVEKIPKEL